MSKLEAYISYWLKDSKGKTKRYRRYRSDSFVGNLLKFVKYILGNVTFNTLSLGYTMYKATPLPSHAPRRLDGTFFTSVRVGIINPLASGLDQTNRGIIIGTGTTAVSLADYSLASQTTALRYESMPSSNISPLDMTDPNVWKFTVFRQFTNTGTTPITITEIGLVKEDKIGRFLIARDVLPTPITVDPNDVIIIQYLIRFRKT
jgi:hypothetical protein